MTKMIVLIIVSAVILVVVAAAVFYNPKVERDSYRRAEVKIGENVLAVEVAETATQMALGLGGREDLGEREGMLFLYEPPARPIFWMKGMKFPIDIIWINDGGVVGVEKDIQPSGFWKGERFSPKGEIDMVLEVKAGAADMLSIREGSRVEVNYDIMEP